MDALIDTLHQIQPKVDLIFDFLMRPFGKLLLCVYLAFMATAINRVMRWRLLVQAGTTEEHSVTRAKWVRRRNLVWLSTALIVLALWSNQITGFLISLAALGGAILIVSKELILCLWGALIISLNKSLKIGTTVEIGKYTGQLINTGFLTFELMEIGPSRKQTGRLLQMPNSLVFIEPLKNLSIYGLYGIHLIDFHFDKSVDLEKAESLLLKLANEAGSQWITKADKHFEGIEKESFVDLPKARPEAFWASQDEKSLRLTLRFACPLSKRGQIEQTIVKRFWTEYSKLRESTNTEANQTEPLEQTASP